MKNVLKVFQHDSSLKLAFISTEDGLESKLAILQDATQFLPNIKIPNVEETLYASVGIQNPLAESLSCHNSVLFETPYDSSYAAKSIMGVSYTHPDSSKLSLAAKIISSKFLHGKIRERGGAYGGGVSYSSLDGLLNFYSYRDPNPAASFKAFEDSLEWFLTSKDVNSFWLEEAKLPILSQYLAPVDFHAQGLSQFYGNLTDAQRQE